MIRHTAEAEKAAVCDAGVGGREVDLEKAAPLLFQRVLRVVIKSILSVASMRQEQISTQGLSSLRDFLNREELYHQGLVSNGGTHVSCQVDHA